MTDPQATDDQPAAAAAAAAAVAAACDALCASVGIREGTALALYVLLLKSASDHWQDRAEALAAQYAGHPDMVEEMLSTQRFIVPPHAAFEALHDLRHAPGNDRRIDRALRGLAEANPGKLGDIFRTVRFGIGPDDLLRRLIEAFAALDLRPEGGDATARACHLLTARLAQRTPPQLARLLARLLDPREGDDICDPACGPGATLAACADLVRERTGGGRYALYGQEADVHDRLLARLTLLLHGEDNHRVDAGDALRQPLLREGRALRLFDVVLGHLPARAKGIGFDAARTDRHSRFRWGIPPSGRADFAYIAHMVETMKPATGRMAVIVPPGVLVRGGAEAHIRRLLIEANLLDTVIGLPAKLLPDGGGSTAAILVLRRQRPDDRVLFVDASRDFDAGRSVNTLRPCDVQRVLDATARRRDIAASTRLATFADIAANDFRLNLPLYVHARGQEQRIDLAALHLERERLKDRLALLDTEITASMKELGHA